MLSNLKNVYYQALEKVSDTVMKAVQRKLPKTASKKLVKLNNVQEMLDSGMHEDEITEFYMQKCKDPSDRAEKK